MVTMNYVKKRNLVNFLIKKREKRKVAEENQDGTPAKV
jgi:hypothetical protein